MANKPRKPTPAPVPRDHADASMSELMPFRSSKVKLWKSPLFIMLVIAGLASVPMFGLMPQVLGQPNAQGIAAFQFFVNLTVFSLLLFMQMAIYIYSKVDRPIFPFISAYVLSGAQLVIPGVFTLYVIVFRQLLPGGIEVTPQTPFVTAFISMFFGAGLCEELLKAVPILLGAWLSIQAMKTPAWREKSWFKLLHVRGPLDGVVMGAFAGAAFIFLETALQYVPNELVRIARIADYGSGVAAALMLMIPRVIGGASHIAYSMIFGYFIGLAVIRPAQKWKLLAIGWLASSLVHALWNSVGQINSMLYYVMSAVGTIFAVAALLKARQIEASQLGGNRETLGSILVDRAPAAPPRPAPAPQAAPAAAAATAASPAAPRARADNRPLVLDVEGLTIPLRGGALLDLGAEPALGGRGSGVRGEVVPHPTKANVLGLRNTGGAAWTARLRDGSQQMIEQGQNIRLAAGVQIDFGGTLAGRVTAVG